MTKVKTYEAGYTSGRERVERRGRQEGKKGNKRGSEGERDWLVAEVNGERERNSCSLESL